MERVINEVKGACTQRVVTLFVKAPSCKTSVLFSVSKSRHCAIHILKNFTVKKFVCVSFTFTWPYFQVKRATAGRQAMMQHSRISIAVRISQFRDTTQGEPSSQNSHPSAHGRHSNTPLSAYWLFSPCWQTWNYFPSGKASVKCKSHRGEMQNVRKALSFNISHGKTKSAGA